ncbi:MAG: ROK family protein [Planctomycetota bacterium]|nr:ROK family protein [Planctomycetota bacterium]
MPEKPFVVGVDLGGTNMQIGVVDAQGAIRGRYKLKTKADKGGDAIVERMAEGIHDACSQAGVKPHDLAGVGVGAPGAIDMATGVVLEAPNLRWNHFPLADKLSREVAGRPVLIDNDVNVAVYGENKLGAARGARDLVGIWIGTGIGGGLVLNGSLYYGSLGTAGEIGQTVLLPGAPLGFRTLEQVCSRKHVVGRLMKLIEANNPSLLTSIVDRGDDVGASAVAEAYRRGDELVTSVMDEVAQFLGVAAANAVTLLSLRMVVLGGGIAEAFGQPLADRVAEAMKPLVFPRQLRDCKVVCTQLADDAGLLGAAMLAQERFGEA